MNLPENREGFRDGPEGGKHLADATRNPMFITGIYFKKLSIILIGSLRIHLFLEYSAS